MKQEVVWTNEADEKQAVNKLVSQLKAEHRDYNLVMFFASVSYNFEVLSKLLKEEFPGSEVVGCSTSGEISKHGFTKNSIVLTTMSCNKTKVKGVAIKDTNKFPMVYKGDMEHAMRECGIRPSQENSHNDAFAITFINGLCNAEEALLAMLYAVIDNEKFQVLGGSAGDDLKFEVTYVSLNGTVITNGGVVVFVKTQKQFVIEKENIFKPSGKKVNLTKVDTVSRTLIEINHRPATLEYSKVVGIDETKIEEASLMHPLGRMFGNNIFISSIASENSNKTLQMYSRVMQNTMVDIMEVDDVERIIDETCANVKSSIEHPGFVFFINCILRTLQFESSKKCDYLVKTYERYFPTFCGFSSYGEQIGKVNSNQTLVVVAVEE